MRYLASRLKLSKDQLFLSSRIAAIAVALVYSNIVSAAEVTPTEPKSSMPALLELKSAETVLTEMANRTPTERAADVAVVKAQMDQRHLDLAKERAAPPTPRTLLRQKFQREIIAARDRDTRTALIAEYQVQDRILAAKEELDRLKAAKAKN